MRFKNGVVPDKAVRCTKATGESSMFLLGPDIPNDLIESGGRRNGPNAVWRQSTAGNGAMLDWNTMTREGYESLGWDLTPLYAHVELEQFRSLVVGYVTAPERTIPASRLFKFLEDEGVFDAKTVAEAKAKVNHILEVKGICVDGAEKARRALGLHTPEWVQRDITAEEANEIIRSLDVRQVSVPTTRPYMSIGVDSAYHRRIVAATMLDTEVVLKDMWVYE